MALEDERTITLIGFLIVLAVGLNIVFIFSSYFGSSDNVLTGLATASPCSETDNGGISCGTTVFPAAANGCISGTNSVCTNTCELERSLSQDTRTCPGYCTAVCVTDDVKASIGK